MTSHEADIAVLKEQVAEILRDNEKRERLQDARHEALMAQLQQVQLTIASGQAFNRGVTSAVKAAWAIGGGAVVGAFTWLVQGGWK